MSRVAIPDKYSNTWQYHSRSDRHSKIACWAILFDLLHESRLFGEHARRGEIVFGINHEMRDFKHDRKKDLDLVVCTPGTPTPSTRKPYTFAALAEKYGIQLDAREDRMLRDLPDFSEGPVGAVRIALEAKACMTAHVRALSRMYDELNSSHATVHGATDIGIAVGFAMVNNSHEFISTDMNKHDLAKSPPNVSRHKQPSDTQSAIDKVLQIPRRTEPGANGFDALGLLLLDFRNDGNPVNVVNAPPAPRPGDVLHYDSMIARTMQLYDFKFGRV